MRLAQFFSPHARKGFVRCLCSCIDSLARHTESCAGRRDEDDAAALGKIRLDSFGQENGPLDIRVKVRII
jgi:hypothetical protein